MNLKATYAFLLILFFAHASTAQPCLTNTLVINTGYDPITNTAITPGANGGTAVIDPHWTVSSISPDVATAIATYNPGYIEVATGNNADIIQNIGGWASTPSNNPSEWISYLNSNGYYDDGNTNYVFNGTLSRSFRMCSNDSIMISINIADDNYVTSVDIDGTNLPFSQAPSIQSSNYTSFAPLTKIVYLTAGTHSLNVSVSNYAVSNIGDNPTGIDIYGTVSSATGSNSLVSEGSIACNNYVCTNNNTDTSCNTVNLPDSVFGCKNTNVNLNSTISGSDTVLSIQWSPTTGLSNTAVINPTLTMTNSGWYHLTVKSIIPYSLVDNGDFGQGNTGFATSYLFTATAPPPGTASIQDHYSIGTNPYSYNIAWPSMGDHTSGTGNMIIIDADTFAAASFWCQTISVAPNTNYVFSVWSALLNPPLPQLQVTINGVNTSVFTTSSTVGQWTYNYVIWNSGSNTTADICLSDINTIGFGNDFAIDDIALQPVCTATDSIYASLQTGDSTYNSTDTGLCPSESVYTLTAPAGYNSFLWSTGDTTPSITIPSSGVYWVSEINSCDGLLVDTFHVSKLLAPNVIATGDTTICQGEKTPMHASGALSYTWEPTNALNDSALSSPIAYPDTTTTYIVIGKDSGGCIGTDSVTVAVLLAPVLKIDSPQIVDCSNRSIQLNASGAMKYRWSPATDFNNPDIATPFVEPMVSTVYFLTGYNSAGCTATDSVQVTVEQEGDVMMPNAFTPNNDGTNDVIYPIVYCDFTFESFSVYNRWGQRIFFTNTYMKGWDGTFNGVQQPMDVFVYYVTGHITGTDKQILRKGNITLIR